MEKEKFIRQLVEYKFLERNVLNGYGEWPKKIFV
jgi:hypothetical protein